MYCISIDAEGIARLRYTVVPKRWGVGEHIRLLRVQIPLDPYPEFKPERDAGHRLGVLTNGDMDCGLGALPRRFISGR